VQIQTRNLEKARDITQWLMSHVGPVIKSTHGTIVRGEGWIMWVAVEPNLDMIVNFELNNEHVDEHTVTLFLLKWS